MKLTVYYIFIPALVKSLWASVSRGLFEFRFAEHPVLIYHFNSLFALITLLGVFTGPVAKVEAQTTPCNFKTLTSNNYSNAGVISGRTGGVGGFLGFGTGSVANAANVADATLTNSATITSAQFTGSGGQISVSADANGGTTIFGAGAIAGFLIANNTALGNNLLPSVTIRTYLDGDPRESSTSSTLQDLTSLAGPNQRALGFATTLDFDEIQIVIANTVSLATSTAVFYPFVQYRSLTVATTVTNASSSTTANGAVFATVSGGRPPFTYSWSNGATTPTISNVAPGTYTVRVTDANSCTTSASATVGIRVAPCPIPGQSGFTVFSFSNLSSTGEGANTLARYSNVATIGGQAVDFIGDVLSLSVNGTSSPGTNAVDFFSSNNQAGFLISAANIRAIVRWTVVRMGTNTPVPFQGSFTVGDLDRIGTAPTFTRTESIELDKSTLYSYKLNVPTSVSVIDQGSSIRFQGTANNAANDNSPGFAVSLNFVGLPSFDIGYNNIGSETLSLFSFDGNGTIVFGANTTCVPVLDTDGDGVADANDIDDDNDGITDDTEGLLADVDGDGIANALDLDSDGDGIPDTIEAQTTSGYIVPTTTVTSLGLPTSYSSTGGLTPVNTDGTDTPDYLDTDSDNDIKTDTNEAGLTLASVDSDEDGLDNNIDTNDAGFGPVNAGITNPLTAYPSNGTQVFWRIKEGTFTYGNCANATAGGTFIIGTASTGVLTIPITTTRDGQVVITVTGPGFTASPTSVTATLVTSQTALAIPFAYNGSGSVGPRSLTVSSSQATGTCSSTVAVIGLADPAISIAQPTPLLLVGQTSSLPITISNLGSAATSGPITTTLLVPANVATPASFTSSGFACVTTGSAVTCTSSAVIATGASTTITVLITPGVATAGMTLSFTGIVGSTTPEVTVNNDVAILSTTVSSSVTARPDAGTASAGTGGVAVVNIVANDIVNTQVATLGAGGNATVVTVGTYPAGITLDTNTGSISVAQGTVPSSYTIVYQLCDRLTPATCATSTIAVTVTPSVTANPDAGTVSAGSGGTAVANVAANDVVNGLPGIPGGTGNAILTTIGTYPAGISLNAATGSVSVVQGIAPGSYTIAYRVCDKLTPATCATTTVTVTVTPSVTATPDIGTVSAGTGSTAVANVVANDLVNGLPATVGTGGNAVLTTVNTYPAGITLNTTTGSVSVAQGTTPGSYTIAYQLCDKLTPITCATTTVAITITPSVIAAPNSGTVSAGTGGTAVANVAANDVVNGLPATLGGTGNATISAIGTYPTGITLNTTTGSVSVAQGTTPGSYTVVYQVCDRLTPATCATTTVTITVIPSVTATPDTGTVSAGVGGTAVANVAANDIINGLPATLGAGGNATLVTVGSYPAGISLNTATGSVSVAKGTTPGAYTVAYQLCDRLTPTTCAITTVTVTVLPSVTATPDTGTVSAGAGGTAVANVAANDVVNGVPATLGTGGNSALNTVGSYPAGIILNTTTGSISVAQGAVPGSYTVAYQLCDRLTPTTCATTTVTVTITPTVTASPDSGTVSAGTGGTAVANVAANDVINGLPATLGGTGNATLTPVGTYPAGISLNTTTGSVSVVQGTAPGSYTIAYQVCDKLMPATCATTAVAVTVTPSVTASPDAGTVSSGTGGVSVANVAANDVVNGLPATLGGAGNATISTVGTYPAGITLNTTTGSISVAQRTAPGSYTVVYQVCDKLTPVTCSTTTVVITVTPRVTANPDSGTVGSGSGGLAVANVATNDVVNGQPATVGAGGNAILTQVGTYPAGISLNTTTGSISVAVGTAQGSFTIVYQLCDKLTPATCATTTVTITVTAVAPVLTGDITVTRPNIPVSGNVLTNDRDPQGLPLAATLLTPPASGTVTLNPDGSYSFTPAAGFTGVATFCYSASNSAGLSSSACVSINIEADPEGGNARPIATNDNVRSFQNSLVRVVVLANDTDPNSATSANGQLALPALVSQPDQGTAVVNGDGSVTYTPPTDFTGVASFDYQLCDHATPALCATATVNINIQPSPPTGVTLTPVGVDDLLLTQLNAPQTGSVAGNDYDPQDLALSYVAGQPTSGTVVMSLTGSYTYTPAVGFTGPASFTYQVCNTGGQCDIATVSVLIQPLPPTVRLLPQVYLQGALFGVTTGSLMRDDLRAGGYLPASHPYDSFNPITPVGTMGPSVTTVTGNNAVVDWVFVELHLATSPAVVVDSRAALLQRDGDIVEVDGVSSLSFAQSILGNYYVAVRHRNHLGVMSQTALPLSATALTVDFRNINTPTYTSSGTGSYTQITADQAQVVVQQGVAMWAGNTLNDNAARAPRNLVIYQGSNNDVNQNYQQVINAAGNVLKTPFYKLRGYQLGDVNLDSQVIYQGTGNDVEFIYQNIVKNHPGNSLKVPFFIIREQVP